MTCKICGAENINPSMEGQGGEMSINLKLINFIKKIRNNSIVEYPTKQALSDIQNIISMYFITIDFHDRHLAENKVYIKKSILDTIKKLEL